MRLTLWWRKNPESNPDPDDGLEAVRREREARKQALALLRSCGGPRAWLIVPTKGKGEKGEEV